MRLPGFDGLRVPARFWMMTLVCLSVLAALAIDRLQGRMRRAVAVVAVIGLALDGWPGEFLVSAAPDRRPTPPGVIARVNLPMTDDRDARVSSTRRTAGSYMVGIFFGGVFGLARSFRCSSILRRGTPLTIQSGAGAPFR